MGRTKRLNKGIRSLERQIAKHREKISAYQGPKEVLLDYWEAEIQRMIKQKEDKEKKISKKRLDRRNV